MKKYHLYLWIIALVGLMTSCSQDETDALQTANESNRVTLTAALPADFVQPQPKTRALPTVPSGYKLRCILEIWDTEATPALKVRKEICPAADATTIDFSFDLSTTGTYKALLWADYINESNTLSSTEIAGLSGVEHYKDYCYTTSDGLKAVKQKTDIAPLNPDLWDAFYASAEFTKASTALAIPKVTLTRPLTRVIIAEKNAERFASCSKVEATFTSPTQFDVATGNVSGENERILSGRILPNSSGSTLNFGTDVTIGGQTCKTLVCFYLFAGATDGTMGEISMKFTATEEGKTLPTVTIPAGIPVKRNHRINAAGNLIGEPGSDAVTMTVDINSDWTTPDEEINMNPVQVGDYYYADGTWSSTYTNNVSNPCIGIVFQTDPSRIGEAEKTALAAKGVSTPHGLVMALQNAATSVAWSTETDKDFSELTNCVSKDNCQNDINGLLNYNAVIAYATENNKLDAYPAFNAVKNFSVTAPENSTGWYLPSVGQWYDIFANLGSLPDWNSASTSTIEPYNDYYWTGQTELVNRINSYFEHLTETHNKFMPSGSSQQYFWSSSEFSNDYARNWHVTSNGLVTCGRYYKSNSGDVRPVFAF